MSAVPSRARSLLRTLCLLFALLLPALAVASTYKGPQAPKPGMAVLNGEQRRVENMYGKGYHGYVGMRIGVVDGDSKRRGLYANSFPTFAHVAPGRHTVRVQYFDGVYSGEVHMWFDAEADKAYTVRFETRGTSIRNWIEETATGVVVGGIGDGSDEGLATGSGAPAAGDPAESAKKDPPPAPDATTAVLVSDPGNGPASEWSTWDGKGINRQEIDFLDGERQRHRGNGYQSLRLAPGRHQVQIGFAVGTNTLDSVLVFTAEANRTYWVRRLTENYRTRFWIEDASTGAKVSEDAPQ
jgi:hypothetical protein